jgi:hypothetical protein
LLIVFQVLAYARRLRDPRKPAPAEPVELAAPAEPAFAPQVLRADD